MKLLPHQIEVLKATKALKNVAHYLDMGLGKTYTGSEKMLAQRIKTVFSLVWQQELQ